MVRKLSLGVAIFGWALMLSGCGLSEATATEKLAEDGLANIKLTKIEGGFTFTATNEEGHSCTGSISGSDSNWQTMKSCVSTSAP